MWEECGVVRDDPSLTRGLARLAELRSRIGDVDVRPSEEGWNDLAQVLDLRAGLTIAEATMKGALVRRESRGCHNRSDYPDLDPALRVNFHMRLEDDMLSEPEPVPVPTVRAELEEWMNRPWDADVEGRLLE
jgi:succinate dehydrogenase / fumarate reductase flavoprotein subunit